jgi:hypothetical protein
METIKISVYSFAELKPEAQKIALEKYREGQDISLDFYGEDALEQIKEAGFIEQSGDGKPSFNYSLGYSQGDGASFTIKSLDLRAFCKAHRLLKKYARLLRAFDEYEASGKITRESCHYYHERSARVWIDANGDKEGAEGDELEQIIEAARYDLCRKLTAQGYKEIEGQQTDEYIKDEIEVNEYRFLESGKRCFYV